jgi:hypothetical protein
MIHSDMDCLFASTNSSCCSSGSFAASSRTWNHYQTQKSTRKSRFKNYRNEPFLACPDASIPQFLLYILSIRGTKKSDVDIRVLNRHRIRECRQPCCSPLLALILDGVFGIDACRTPNGHPSALGQQSYTVVNAHARETKVRIALLHADTAQGSL